MCYYLTRFMFLALLIPALFSCGGADGFSDKVIFEVTPDVPIASPADTSYKTADDEIVTVTGPWYLIVFNIENRHPTFTLVIDSIELKSSVYNGSQRVNATTTLSLDSSGCEPGSTNREHFAVIQPGELFTGDGNCNGTVESVGDTENWYIGSLPTGSNLSYTVEATVYGTFRDLTDSANPIRGRLQKTVYFVTQ